MVRALLPVVVIVLVAVACDSFSPGSEDSPWADAGAVSTDAGTDATEAGEPDAATPDAADADASPPVALCGPKQRFCDDFSGPLGAKWLGRSEGAGPLSLDQTVFGLGAPSLKVEVVPALNPRATYLETTFDGAQRVIVGASVAFTRAGSVTGTFDGEVALVNIELVPTPPGFMHYMVALVARPNGELVLQEQAGGTQVVGTLGAAMTRVALDLDLDAGLVRARNGAVDVQAPTARTQSTGQRLRIGAPYASNTQGAYVVRFDDIAVD